VSNSPIPTEATPTADLTLRERRFVEEYIVDLNGRQAAIRAGLGKSVKSATEMASRLRKNPAVAAAISALMTERSGVTAAAVVGELGAIAFSRISNYLKIQDGRLVLAIKDLNALPDEAVAAIAKLKERVNDDGSISIEVELHDKITALTRLGQSISLFKEKSESTVHHTVELVDPMARIKERLASLRRSQQDGAEPRIDPPVQRAAIPAPRRTPPTIDA
jgi:phage terminase small subunit